MNKNPESKQFWRLFGPLLLYWVIQFVARFIVEMFAIIPHLGEIIDYSAFSDNMTQDEIMNLAWQNAGKVMEIVQKYQVEILGFAALFTIPLTLSLFLMDRKREKLLNIPQNKKANLWKYGEIIGLGVAVCIGANCLTIMSSLAMTSQQYQETSEVFYSASVPVQIFCLGLVIPLTEELMFRGVLFKRYRERGSFMKAAVCSSLLFGLIHGNIVQFLYSFILGLLLSYVYEKYGSFKAPAVLHVVANITSLIVTEIGGFDWLAAKVSRMGIAAVVCAFAGSIMFVLIQKIDEKPDVTPPPAENKITPDMFR